VEIATVAAEVDLALEASVANRIEIAVSAPRRAKQKSTPQRIILATRMIRPNAGNDAHEAAAAADATETTRRTTRQPLATTVRLLTTAVQVTKIADAARDHVTATEKSRPEAIRI
jgi:hypothetical protein